MQFSPVEYIALYSTGLTFATWVISGLAKVGRASETLHAMAALRVPASLQRRWLAHSLPLYELALAAGLLLASGPAATLAHAISAATLAVFAVLLIAALRRGYDVDCGCFGPLSASDKVTSWSAARNIGLIAISLVGMLGVSGYSAGSRIFTTESADLAWLLLGWALTAVTLLIIELLKSKRQATVGSEVEAQIAQMGDRIPDVEAVTPEGVTRSLGMLGDGRPTLLLFLSAECASCRETAKRVPEWSEQLGNVQLKVLTSSRPQQIEERIPGASPFLVFGAREAKKSLGVKQIPAAVMLGNHEMPVVASPVVYGAQEIGNLVNTVSQASASTQQTS